MSYFYTNKLCECQVCNQIGGGPSTSSAPTLTPMDPDTTTSSSMPVQKEFYKFLSQALGYSTHFKGIF